MKDNKEYIYIVLVKSHTLFGRLARVFDKYEYTHIAYCPDEELKHFVSFSREKHYAPFESGFSRETMDCFAYGKNETVKLKVFKVPVESENMRKINTFIEKVEKERDEYKFNLYAAVTKAIFHGFRIYKTFNCMSFVGKILELSGSVPMDKKYYKYDIETVDKMLGDYFYSEGEYKREELLTPDYMDRVGLLKNVLTFVSLNVTLICRMICKNPNSEE